MAVGGVDELYFPQPPLGYVSFFFLIGILCDSAEEWRVENQLLLEQLRAPGHAGSQATLKEKARRFERFVAPQLATGTLRAVGMHLLDGELIWAPPAAWRRPMKLANSAEMVSPVLAALWNEPIAFPAGNGRSYRCYPIIELRALALAFGATAPPPPSMALPIRDLEAERSLGGQVAAEGAPRSGRVGGRPPAHAWDDFWAEVTCWASKEDLVPASERRPELRRHMLSWCAQHWAQPPDATTIDKKLSILFKRAARAT